MAAYEEGFRPILLRSYYPKNKTIADIYLFKTLKDQQISSAMDQRLKR
jgi:hypothetical protein